MVGGHKIGLLDMHLYLCVCLLEGHGLHYSMYIVHESKWHVDEYMYRIYMTVGRKERIDYIVCSCYRIAPNSAVQNLCGLTLYRP